MHGRKWLLLSLIFIAGCSGNSLMSPDCHSCTIEEQAWNDFSWQALPGQWKGSVESVKNDRGTAKRLKTDQKVEFRFLSAADFLKARNSTCDRLPGDAVVMNGQLWEAGTKKAEYETFVPVEEGKVAYGRLSFEKMNGKEVCQFRRLGRVMGTNRLALPMVSFSEHSTVSGRSLASMANDAEYSVEFLRFAAAETKAQGRGPASVERPPLMIRVSRTSSRNAGERGEWSGSEEQIFRLWKN